jgi:enoyl-CoA hydratase/carnithine racemase
MTDAPLTFESDGRVARLTFNRPEHDNLINDEMMQGLGDHLTQARGTTDILVVQARGEHFTIGRDRGDKASGMTREQSLALAMDVNGAVADFDGLIVTAVRGRAMGFGSGLVVQSDIVAGTETSTYGFDEVVHGFPPMIVMSYLGRYVLPRHAFELVVTGREISAREALSFGIVNRVVADEALEDAVDELVDSLSALDLSAAKRAKRYLREIEAVEIADRRAYALRAQLDWFERGV